MNGRLLSIDTPLARSPYPERENHVVAPLDEWSATWLRRMRAWVALPVRAELGTLKRAQEEAASQHAALDDVALRTALRQHAVPAVHDLKRADLHAALVLVGEAARRTLGKA